MSAGDRIWRMKLAWKTLFAGPLRIKVTIERPDGTELAHFYPLDRDVLYGMRVDMSFTVGDFDLTEA